MSLEPTKRPRASLLRGFLGLLWRTPLLALTVPGIGPPGAPARC